MSGKPSYGSQTAAASPARARVSAYPRTNALTPKIVGRITTPLLVGASGWARKPNKPSCLISWDLGDMEIPLGWVERRRWRYCARRLQGADGGRRVILVSHLALHKGRTALLPRCQARKRLVTRNICLCDEGRALIKTRRSMAA